MSAYNTKYMIVKIITKKYLDKRLQVHCLYVRNWRVPSSMAGISQLSPFIFPTPSLFHSGSLFLLLQILLPAKIKLAIRTLPGPPADAPSLSRALSGHHVTHCFPL